jgi:Ca2+-binding EF-hand superfamily protein
MRKLFLAVATLAVAGSLAARAEETKKPEGAQGQHRMPMVTLDKDGDGKITVAEFAAQGAEFSKMRFTRADTDGDGKVTAAELESAREKQAARAGQPGSEGRPRAEIPTLASVDTDKDGAITPEEFAAYSTAKATERAKGLDKDGDGVLSKEELPMGGPGGPGGRVRGPPAGVPPAP